MNTKLIDALKALTADWVEENPDEGVRCFFCCAEVRYTYDGLKCTHREGCALVQGLTALREAHDE